MSPAPPGEPPPAGRDDESVLLAQLLEWRRVTEAESEAIRNGRWDQLLGLQAIKSRLRQEMDAPQTGLRESDWVAARRLAGELIEMERANHQLLAERREQAVAERNSVDVARANLKRLQTRFVTRPGSTWQCYS
jgi:hypothetical protein